MSDMTDEKLEKSLSRSFYFEGPKSPTRQHGCATCVSAAAKLCMQHAGPTPGCTMCGAAETGTCPTHGRGLHVALDQHEASITGDDAKAEWQSDRAYIEAKAARIPDSAGVRVRAHGYSGIMDAWPRLSAIEVIQLKP